MCDLGQTPAPLSFSTLAWGRGHFQPLLPSSGAWGIGTSTPRALCLGSGPLPPCLPHRALPRATASTRGFQRPSFSAYTCPEEEAPHSPNRPRLAGPSLKQQKQENVSHCYLKALHSAPPARPALSGLLRALLQCWAHAWLSPPGGRGAQPSGAGAEADRSAAQARAQEPHRPCSSLSCLLPGVRPPIRRTGPPSSPDLDTRPCWGHWKMRTGTCQPNAGHTVRAGSWWLLVPLSSLLFCCNNNSQTQEHASRSRGAPRTQPHLGSSPLRDSSGIKRGVGLFPG